MTPQEALKLKAQARLRLQQKAAGQPHAALTGMTRGPNEGAWDYTKRQLGEGATQVNDALRVASDYATFGLGDKLAAGVDSALGQGDYASNVAQNRAMSEGANKRLGPMGPVMAIGGSMLPVARAAQLGVTAARIPGIVGKLGGMALDGMGYGALQAAGHDQNIGEGAATGLAAGAVGQGAGAILSKALSKLPATMSKEQLYAAGTAAFNRAKSYGVIFKPEGVAKLRDAIHNDFAELSYHPKLQPGAEVALGELERLSQGGNVDFQGLKTAREIASDAFIPGNKKNNMLIGKVIKHIDEFASNPDATHVLTGDSAAAAQAQKDARAFWHRASKLDTVDTLTAKAETRAGSTGSGGNVENATRQNLRKILDSEAKSRGFTADEKAMLTKAVMGTKTHNLLRQLGKFSPVGNGLIGSIEGTAALSHSLATGNPAMAIPYAALATAGTGAKFASEAMQRKGVSELQALIAAGGKKEAITKTLSPERAKMIETLTRALMMGGTTAALGSR